VISLVDPAPASVITHEGGLITVRLFDFPGAARGTLTTPADALSTSGTVIKDTQTIAVQTSFTSDSTLYGLAADSVVIPLSSLNREDDIDYQPYIGMRLEGDVPTNAQAFSSWIAFRGRSTGVFSVAGPGVGSEVDGAFAGSVEWLPRSLIAEYTLREMPFIVSHGDTAGDFVIRAWGIAGGTLAIFLDTLYLVPVSGDEIPENTRWLRTGPADFAALSFDNDGTLFRDEDNDDLWWPGKFSVFLYDSVWTPGSDRSAQLADFQEDDSEVTVADANGDESWDGSDDLPPDPKSWMWYPVGGTQVGDVTLITDNFSVAATAGGGVSSNIDEFIRFVETGTASQVSTFWDAPGTTRRGFFIEVGSGVGTAYYGATGAGGLPNSPFGWLIDRAEIGYGQNTLLSGSGSDPRNYKRTLWPHLYCFEAVARFRLRDNMNLASAQLGRTGSYNETGREDYSGAWLQFDGTAAKLYLIISYDSGQIYDTISGPITIDASYTLDEWIWVRVRKDGYHWRARAWEDGTTEPTTWGVDGYEPLLRRPQVPAVFVDYEWDDNWVLSADNDAVFGDPRGGPADPQARSGFTAGIGIGTTVKHGQPRCRIEVDDFQLKWDPTSGSLGDMSVHQEKYDGSVDYGTVVVPYGSHRFIQGSFDNYHFNGDTNGYNIRLWKEAGSPDYMTAGMGLIYERAPFGGIISLSHLRVANRYGTRVTVRA